MTIVNRGANGYMLVEVFSVTATETEGAYIVDLSYIDESPPAQRVPYMSYPNDQNGLNPILREWLEEHEGEYAIIPYEPPAAPTPEEIRAAKPRLTPRQLRLALIRDGKSIASIKAGIDAIPDPSEREVAQTEWDYAEEYQRVSPFINTLAGIIGYGPEAMDILWDKGLSI